MPTYSPPCFTPSVPGSSQRGLEETGWTQLHGNQVAQNLTLLLQAAEVTLWIICVSEDGS